MSISFTKNLKLRIDSRLDDDSKFNLNRIDTLASLYQTNVNDQAIVRSKTDVFITPNSPDIGGSGVGGIVEVGSPDQLLSAFIVNATSISFNATTLSLLNTTGTNFLNLQFTSADTAANRQLSIDLLAGNRQVSLGGNFSINRDFAVLLTTPTNGQVLAYNFATSQWINEDPSSSSTSDSVSTWLPGDGAVKIVNHGLNSQHIRVQLFNELNQVIEIDTIEATDLNNVTLTANRVPTGTWTVLLTKVG